MPHTMYTLYTIHDHKMVECGGPRSRSSHRKHLAHPQGSANPATRSKRPAGYAYTPKPTLGESPEGEPGTRRPWQAHATPRNGGTRRRRRRTTGDATAANAQDGAQSITLKVTLKAHCT